MEFLGIGAWELMMVGLIALIVLGPKQMIILARRAGELLRQFQDIWQEASKTIDKEIKAIEAEAGDLTQLPKEITALTNEMKSALTLNPKSNGRAQLPPAPAPEPSIQPPATPAAPSAWAATPPPAAPAAAAPSPTQPATEADAGTAAQPEPNTAPATAPAPAPAPPPTTDSQAKYPAWTAKRN